ncbi:hypothetical protein BS78_05G249300 [Paspalum vaginatum]|nr:hypothetical protein BS78_05G249300 [Paspalum vaginatum]
MAERAPASTGGSSMGGGEEASDVKAEILSLAASIVEKAKWLRQNEEEIQQLVQWVEQAASIIRASELSGDPEMLNDLKLHLKDARNIVLHNRQHESYSSNVGKKFVCGVDGAKLWQEPEDILQVASKIESYVQVLPAVVMPAVPDNASGSTRGHPLSLAVACAGTTTELRTGGESSEDTLVDKAETLSLAESMVVDDASIIKAEILSLVESIEKEATPIKQLLRAVQHAGGMMQNLQASDLSCPEAMPMLNDLKQHLKAAQDIVDGGADSWQQRPDQILQVTSKIEYYVQVLPAVVTRWLASDISA